jgi:UTP--glucose-1-phosphate uridylyltransferase
MEVKKAVIPAAGLGTRLLPATKAQPKEMFPIVDTPAIQMVVTEAVAAGITDILIITGRGEGSIEDHFDRTAELEALLEAKGKTEELQQVRDLAEMASIHFVRQSEALGLGHAVSVAEAHVGDEPFAVLLGDDLIHPDVPLLRGMLDLSARLGCSVLGSQEVSREAISAYGCITPVADSEPDADSGAVRVASVIEKPAPEDAPSLLASIGRYVFTPGIFAAIAATGPGKGGEIQITDAVNRLTEAEPVYALPFDRGRFDVGNKLGYLQATVELGLEHDEIGEEFAAWLGGFVRDRGLPGG